MSDKVVISCSSHPIPQRTSAPRSVTKEPGNGRMSRSLAAASKSMVSSTSGSPSFIFWTCPQVNVSHPPPPPPRSPVSWWLNGHTFLLAGTGCLELYARTSEWPGWELGERPRGVQEKGKGCQEPLRAGLLELPARSHRGAPASARNQPS